MPGTTSCFIRMLGRKKLCSTSALLMISSTSSSDGKVDVAVDANDVVRRVQLAVGARDSERPN